MSEHHDIQTAPLLRTIKLSDTAWQEGKAKAAKLVITVRQLIEEAVASEMPGLIRTVLLSLPVELRQAIELRRGVYFTGRIHRKRYFDKDEAADLRRRGWGQIRIAKELGIGRINKCLHEEYEAAGLAQ